MHRKFKATVSLAVAVLSIGATHVPVTIFALVGRDHLSARGEAECKHAPVAAIYGVRSRMWSIQFSDPGNAEIRQLQLTMWQPQDDAPAQINLSLQTAKSRHRIETVEGAAKMGSGSITFRPQGLGGTFELRGNSDNGTPLQVRVVCPRINALHAVGG